MYLCKRQLLVLSVFIILLIPSFLYAQLSIGPQVRIRLKVIEWALDDSLDYGISSLFTRGIKGYDENGNPIYRNSIVKSFDLTFPSQSLSTQGIMLFLDNIDLASGALETTLQLLEQSGKVKILSAPTIITMKGAAAPAVIQTGSDVPYEATQVAGATVVQVTKFEQTGIVLKVNVIDVIDDYVKIQTDSSVSTMAGYISVATDANRTPILVPQVATRSMRNIVLIKDGDTLIAGILKVKGRAEKERTVPFVGSIPIIKYLFTSHSSSKKDTELTFLISPEIMKEEIKQVSSGEIGKDESNTPNVESTPGGTDTQGSEGDKNAENVENTKETTEPQR